MQKRDEAQKTKQTTLNDVGREAMIDPATWQPYTVSGPLKIGQERSDLLELVGLIAQAA